MPAIRMNRSAVPLADRHHRIDLTSALILVLLFTGCVPEEAERQSWATINEMTGGGKVYV